MGRVKPEGDDISSTVPVNGKRPPAWIARINCAIVSL